VSKKNSEACEEPPREEGRLLVEAVRVADRSVTQGRVERPKLSTHTGKDIQRDRETVRERKKVKVRESEGCVECRGTRPAPSRPGYAQTDRHPY
jgi:hypothetical protein